MQASARTEGPPTSARRALIVDTTRQLLAEYGVHGVTIALIADTAGISQGGIYRHFRGRTELLVAVIDAIFEQIYSLYDVEPGTDPLEQLRIIARRHTTLMIDASHSFARPWLEFIAAAPRLGLRDAIAAKQNAAVDALEAIAVAGQESGSIRADVDPRQLAWEFLSWAWGENVASTIGLVEFVDEGRSSRVIASLLAEAASTPEAHDARPSA